VTLEIKGDDFAFPVDAIINGQRCELVDFTKTTIHCVLGPSAGFNRTCFIQSQEEYSRSLDFLSYSPPEILKIEGCEMAPDGKSAELCDRYGSSRLTISGTNFGKDKASVLIGSSRCLNISHDSIDPHTRLYCTAPGLFHCSLFVCLFILFSFSFEIQCSDLYLIFFSYPFQPKTLSSILCLLFNLEVPFFLPSLTCFFLSCLLFFLPSFLLSLVPFLSLLFSFPPFLFGAFRFFFSCSPPFPSLLHSSIFIIAYLCSCPSQVSCRTPTSP
jgi:hypothetical protein